MRRVYIALSSAGVGGAEKRFTDNWHQLITHEGLDVHLVMDRLTHTGLLEQAGYADILASSPQLHVLDLGGNCYRAFCRAMWKFFAGQPKAAIVHYPLAYAPILQTRFGHRLVMSWVNSAMPPFGISNWKNGVGTWSGLLAADHVDVLNPNNLSKISRVPGMAPKMTLTAGGTQVDTRRYKPLSKVRNFVFLGRAEAEKQSLRLVECLPQVHQMLTAAGHQGFRFVVCGDGREAGAIRALSTSPAFQGVPFEFGYSSDPDQVLGAASVYFSLQRTSNYPSKALAEAMVCGAWPILTDVGESRLMVEGCPHYSFVPRDFGPADIFAALNTYLSLSPDARQAIVQENSAAAARRFAAGQQAKYFAEIYRRVGATP